MIKVIELTDPSVTDLEETLNKLETEGHKLISVFAYTSVFLELPYTRIVYREIASA